MALPDVDPERVGADRLLSARVPLRDRRSEGLPMTNPLQSLANAGQAPWLDFLSRTILEDGDLDRLIAEDGLRGLTSNPAIFERAIGGGETYDGALAARIAIGDADVIDLYEHLAIADIQAAADRFRPLWERMGGRDGFVSLEVSPYLAMDTGASLAEARRLWTAVDRPNLMIKIPGTAAGVPAIRALIGEGINVNVTLLFSVEAYAAAAEAHIAGLEDLRARGGEVSRVHGVASLFVSRIDGVIDKAIDARLAAASPADAEALAALRGKVAIANAKAAYQAYLSLVATPRWKALEDAGAAPQRLLWASTGGKDPAYSDVLYVEALIGPDTVDTLPPATLDAFRDHGVVGETLTQDAETARQVLAEAERLGLDLRGVTEALVADGVVKFAQAFDQLLAAVAGKRIAILGDRLNAQSIQPGALEASAAQSLNRAATEGWTRRLWQGDAALWTGGDEATWLGWLGAAEGEAVDLADLEAFRGEVAARAFTHALLLGMGGSSLGPEVLATTFGAAAGFPALLVLDSTDPAQVARVAGLIDPARTLFIVASKSGSTLEPDVLHAFFYDLTETALGAGEAGGRFIAITDPGSKLETLAREQGFWRIFHGLKSIGGRYSALSNFGMVPAAILGLDVRAVFERVAVMARACGPSAPPTANPGFALGALLGAAAGTGRDKVTLIASDGIADLGAWLEQLIAESTGKRGKGLIPVNGESLGPPSVYGDDRLFAYLRLAGQDDPAKDEAVRALEEAGHPVARITLASPETLFQEFFRWEVAVAVAGAIMGIDPFDQPDVEASKIKTRALTDAYTAGTASPAQTPIFECEGVALYADPANAAALAAAVAVPTLEAFLGAHFARGRPGDYLAILAYLDRTAAHHESLLALRMRLRDRLRLATTVQFGPRFLHSTGQAYKGGPNSGVFLQITAEPANDLDIPGRAFSFGVVEAAQAQGDFAVLAERGRRLLRAHLQDDTDRSLARLLEAAERGLS
jgi:transaldolase/glucose-6-phosphate isomerase